jgi:protein-disulfide isomerase
MQDNRHFLPLAVVIAGALIAAAIFFGTGRTSGPKTQVAGAVEASADIAPVTANDHIIGSPDAKVVIVEYSDTECPFCKVFHGTLQKIMDTYKGQSIAWVYRQFPIAELHTKAPKEAEATECAAELGGQTTFWNFTNKVFATTNSNDSLDPSQLPIIARSVGLDVTAFNQCLSSGKYADKIAKDAQTAFDLGAQGTPYTVVVSGTKKTIILGAQDFNTVKAVIDPLLQ